MRRREVGVLLLILVGAFTWGATPGGPQTLVVCPEEWTWYWDCPYTSIQAAIDAAQPGDTILIHGTPQGPATYKENLKIDVTDLTLKGEDRRLVLIQGLAEDEPAIHVQSSSNKVAIAGVTISNSPIGILADGEVDIGISWSAFEGNGVGVELHDQAGATIEGTEFNRQKDTGIAAYDETQLTVRKCEFWHTFSEATGGVEVWVGGEAQALIQGSRFQPGGASISISDLAKATIEDNEFLGEGGGIMLGVDRMPHVMLSNLPQASYAIIRGNRIHDLEGRGVTTYLDSQAIIQSNEIFGNKEAGIWVNGWAVVQGNQIYGNGHESPSSPGGPGGIVVDTGGNALILGNRIQGNNGYGIEVRAETGFGNISPARASITGNLISENSHDGVLLWTSELLLPEEERKAREPQVKLWGNEISGNGGWGIAATVRECYPEYEQLPESFLGTIEGGWNEIHDNGQGNLCPQDYPWPEGFVKEGG